MVPMEKIIKVVLEKLMLLEEIMIISTGKDILWWPRETLTDEAAKGVAFRMEDAIFTYPKEFR